MGVGAVAPTTTSPLGLGQDRASHGAVAAGLHSDWPGEVPGHTVLLVTLNVEAIIQWLR